MFRLQAVTRLPAQQVEVEVSKGEDRFSTLPTQLVLEVLKHFQTVSAPGMAYI